MTRVIDAAAPAADGSLHWHHTVPPDHPAFAGHFPGQPIWPGVCLLAEVFEGLRRAPALSAQVGPHPGVAAVKFAAPVRPGDTLALTIRPGAGGLQFDVRLEAGLDGRLEGRVAASGRLVAAARSR